MGRLARIGAVLVVASLAAGAVGMLAYRAGRVTDEHEGIAFVPSDEFLSFEFRVFGNGMEIGYRFAVESGPNVDIYLLSPGDFARYEAGLLLAVEFPSEEHEDVRFVDGSPYSSEGTWVAVIDNTNYGIARPEGREAVVRYDLSAGGYPGRDVSMIGLMMDGFLILLLFVFCGGVVLLAQERIWAPSHVCPACHSLTPKLPCSTCGAPGPAGR